MHVKSCRVVQDGLQQIDGLFCPSWRVDINQNVKSCTSRYNIYRIIVKQLRHDPNQVQLDSAHTGKTTKSWSVVWPLLQPGNSNIKEERHKIEKCRYPKFISEYIRFVPNRHFIYRFCYHFYWEIIVIFCISK